MMEKKIIFLLFVLSVSLIIENADAGWKFWKKDKKDEESTPTPEISSTSTTTTTTPSTILSQQSGSRVAPKPGSTNKAIAGAADPGLVIGVGNSGTNVRANARPNQPNPGTEVGFDLPGSKPTRPGVGGNNGQGYRDFVLDLTEPERAAPKLPSKPPVISPGGGVPSPIGVPTAQKPGLAQPIPSQTPKPGVNLPPQQNQGGQAPTRPGLPQASSQPVVTPKPGVQVPTAQITPAPRPQPSVVGPQPGKPAVSTLNVGPITPGNKAQQPTPGSPTLPLGGKSWAEIAGNGGKPSSTIPSSPVNPGGLLPGQAAASSKPIAGGATSTTTTTAGGKVYSSEPKYSKGNQVTDDDLEKLGEALFIKDTNNAYRFINLNLQKKTTGDNKNDEAPQPLFTVNSQALQIPTIAKVITIYDNYQLDSRSNEYISPAQRNEESLLVDTFLSTNVMSSAMRFLADKGYLAKDYYAYKDTLRRIWFNLYSRGDGKIGSSGFEHVFLTELKLGTEVSGLHNWIYFNAEEIKKRADYLGYIKKIDLGDKAAILKIHAKFNGFDKPVTSLFVGTSPELEMALYTVCFFVREDKACPVSLGGTKFNIITHKFKYRGKDLIGSAFPDI